MMDEIDFLPADKRQRFLQSDTNIKGMCAQHAQIVQNNKFAISLQYLKKEMSDAVDFLHEQIGMKAYYRLILSF